MTAGRYTPPLTVEATGPVSGRMLLRAEYASSRAGVRPHTTTGKDDGSLTACDCEGWQRHMHCWHCDRLALDYFTKQHAGDDLAALQWRTLDLLHWLGLGPDEADERAARIELSAIGDLIAERTESEAA